VPDITHDLYYVFNTPTKFTYKIKYIYKFFYYGAIAPIGSRLHNRGFTITLRHTTFGRTPLDEWTARRWDLYLTTHNTHKRQTSMPLVGFETTIPVNERPQTHALDRTVTWIGTCINY